MNSQIQQQDQAGGITATPPMSGIEAGVSNLSLEAAAASRQENNRSAGEQQQPRHSTTTGEISESISEMQNRAGQSNSPYVQSHASSPVKWQLLDSEAVDRARRENKLIFLNVGFKACHCTYPLTSTKSDRPGRS
jgi:hypothetical protein